MRPLLALSTAIDQLNEKIGYICNFLVLLACLPGRETRMRQIGGDRSLHFSNPRLTRPVWCSGGSFRSTACESTEMR